jgi:P4 family phage/plasmid primase-like protien
MKMKMEEKKEPPSAAAAAMQFLATPGGRHVRYWRQDAYIYEGGAYCRVDDGFIASLARRFVVATWSAKHADHAYVLAMVETIKQARYTDVRWQLPFRLDGAPLGDCLVLANGVLHLGAMYDGGQPELLPHNPNFFTLGRAAYDYDPSAKAPLYESFLDWLTCGCGQTRELLLESMAYTLLLGLQYQKFFWQIGVGANGKSVFLHVLRHLVGESSVSAIPLERLGKRFQAAALLGCRVNIACDVSDLTKVYEGSLKQLSDGSPVDCERKYKDTLSVVVPTRLVFASNSFPAVRDRSDGLWRRLILVPMEAKVEQEIPQYERRLCAELSGVLNLVLAAGARLIARGHFDVPERCKLLAAEYRLEMDSAQRFCRERLVREKKGFIPTDMTYSQYHDWARSNGGSPVGDRKFWRTFRAEFAAGIADKTVYQTKRSVDGSKNRFPGWAGVRYLDSYEVAVEGEVIEESVEKTVDVPADVYAIISQNGRRVQELEKELKKLKKEQKETERKEIKHGAASGYKGMEDAEVDRLLDELHAEIPSGL